MESENKKMAAKTPDSSDLRIRQSQHSAITKKFLDAMMEYKQIQTKYQDKYKQRMQRQILIANPNATEAEVVEMVASGGAVFAKQVTHQKGEAKRALQDIQERHADIVKIERSIIELQQLFMDMSVMVMQKTKLYTHYLHHLNTSSSSSSSSSIHHHLNTSSIHHQYIIIISIHHHHHHHDFDTSYSIHDI